MNSASIILEHLRQQEDGYVFTTPGLAAKLGLSSGSVTGFTSRLLKAGAIQLEGIQPGRYNRRCYTYKVVDLSLVETRNHSGPGSKPGRILNGRTSKEKLVELLIHVAERLEAMEIKRDIADFSTSELLKELARRTNA